MHGRRQFVIWIVPLSGVTNATLVVCYICQTRLPPQKFTKSILRIFAGEEGEDDARSACPFDTLGYTRDTMDITTGCDEEILS